MEYKFKLEIFPENWMSCTIYSPPQYETIGPESGISSTVPLALAPRNYEMPTQPNLAYGAGVTPNVYEKCDEN